MATKFALKAEVVIGRPLIGKVEEIRFDPKTGEPSYLVGWAGAEGEATHRWFAENEIAAS